MARVIIHGVHRSGTSLTASFFARAGFWYAEPEYQMHPQADNPKGFWERTDVVELNDKILADLGLNWFTLTPKLHDKEIDDLARKFKQDIKAVARRLDDHNSWFLKDPRFSVTWPLWSPHLEPSHHIVLNRHPESVAMSLSRRNHIDIDQGLIFWYHQTRMIASALLGETNVHQYRVWDRDVFRI